VPDSNRFQTPPRLAPKHLQRMAEAVIREARPADQRATFLWTVPHTSDEGKRQPAELGRQGLADVMCEVYDLFGKPMRHWSCFMERHGSGDPHLHCLIATRGPTRWVEAANALRARGVFANCQTAGSSQSYWSMFAYCYVPSDKKSLSSLDQEPLLSPGLETAEAFAAMEGHFPRATREGRGFGGEK
jgi:hypothetical protein